MFAKGHTMEKFSQIIENLIESPLNAVVHFFEISNGFTEVGCRADGSAAITDLVGTFEEY